MKVIAITLVRRPWLFAVAAAAVAVASAFSPSNCKRSQCSVSSYLLPTSTVAPNGFFVKHSRLFDGKSRSFDKDDEDSPLDPAIAAVLEDLKVEDEQVALERGRAFVKSIMENEYESIPNSDGMSILRNVATLEIGITRDVVLRNITVPFWQQCLDLVNTSGMLCRVAAIGAPGIGKSMATLILIRMLLQQEKTVVYLVRSQEKEGWYYEFVPGPNNSILTKVYPESIQRYEIPSLLVKSTYYIVDPGATRDNCNPPRKFAPKVILVLSPDSVQWGGPEFTKGQGSVLGFLKSMPLWTLEEILSAWPILRPDLTVGVVRDMYRLFDGVPHDVFDDYSDSYMFNEKTENMNKISFFKKDKKEREVILTRMICAYLHEKPKSQADFPTTSQSYKMADGFSAIDSYWTDNVRGTRFEESDIQGILYRPFIVDEMMQLVHTALRQGRARNGIMIKGPHGIGKSHSIVNLVRKLLYDSDGKYFVTFIPNCNDWNDLGSLYDAICNSFGFIRTNHGLNDWGKGPAEEGTNFREFIAIIDKILAEKGMKWVFVFDQINKLFTEPVFNELKDISALPFPFNAIESVMKIGRITSIISASANNEVSHRDSHEGFMEYDHSCTMSKDEINAAFQEVGKLKGKKKVDMVYEVTGGVPLQVANLIKFDFSIERYQKDAMKYVRGSLEKLQRQSNTEDFASITEAAVACLLSLNGSDQPHDRKYSIISQHDGKTYYKPLFPIVIVAYRKYFWNSLMMFVKEKEKQLLEVCRDTSVTADVRGRLFENIIITRFSNNANITLDVAWDFPMLEDCNLVNTFVEQKLPDVKGNGMYVPISSNFPAVDLIWKYNKSVCGVQVHIAAHKDTFKQFEALCTDAGWFKKFDNVCMLYLSPTTDVTASMQKYVSKWQGERIQVAAVSMDKIACLADLQW